MKKFLAIALLASISQVVLISALPHRHDKTACVTMQKNQVCYSYNSGLYTKCINNCEEANVNDTVGCEVFCQRRYFKVMDV